MRVRVLATWCSAAAWLMACAGPTTPPPSSACVQDDFEYVFRDFQFVGDVRAEGSKTLQEHGAISLSFSRSISTHRRYIFHLDSARTTEELSRVLIPEVLRSRGFVVLSAPQSDDDYVLADIGEPLWVIDFEKGDCRGSIYNHVCPN